jgi:hypothetical protein
MLIKMKSVTLLNLSKQSSKYNNYTVAWKYNNLTYIDFINQWRI